MHRRKDTPPLGHSHLSHTNMPICLPFKHQHLSHSKTRPLIPLKDTPTGLCLQTHTPQHPSNLRLSSQYYCKDCTEETPERYFRDNTSEKPQISAWERRIRPAASRSGSEPLRVPREPRVRPRALRRAAVSTCSSGSGTRS